MSCLFRLGKPNIIKIHVESSGGDGCLSLSLPEKPWKNPVSTVSLTHSSRGFVVLHVCFGI